MMTNYLQIRKVEVDGTIKLEAEPGTEYLLMKKPLLPQMAAHTLQRPRAMLDEVVGYVREHSDLGRRQVREFVRRYGNPQEKIKGYVSRLSPEEFQKRAKEFNDVVQKRFDDLSKDIEARYEKLEEEFDATVERIFGRQEKAIADAAEATEAAIHGVKEAVESAANAVHETAEAVVAEAEDAAAALRKSRAKPAKKHGEN